jgi:hypothetical protein
MLIFHSNYPNTNHVTVPNIFLERLFTFIHVKDAAAYISFAKESAFQSLAQTNQLGFIFLLAFSSCDRLPCCCCIAMSIRRISLLAMLLLLLLLLLPT